MTTSDFDDHGTVVALEYFVKRIIAVLCLRLPDPKNAVSEWQSGAEELNDSESVGLLELMATNTDVGLNMLSVHAERTRIVSEIVELVILGSGVPDSLPLAECGDR